MFIKQRISIPFHHPILLSNLCIYYCRNFKNYRLLRIQSGSGQEFLGMSAISTASRRCCDVHDSAMIQGCSNISMLCLLQIQILLWVTRPITIFIKNLSA